MTASKNIFSTSETAFAVDRNGKIVAWNRAAEKTFGYLASEAMGRLCWELLSGSDIFGNKACCEGCPIHSTAFSHELVNRFQIDFGTADHKRKRFTVATLLLDGSGEEVLVHLCHLDSNDPENFVSSHKTSRDSKPTSMKNHHSSLTPRETEVLSLLAEGKTIQEIADAMSIAVSTVRNHSQHLLVKLQVHSQREAIIRGSKLGLI